MKQPALATLACAALLLAAVLPVGAFAEGGSPPAAMDVSVKIEGKSTLHGWEVDAGAPTLTFHVKSGGEDMAREVAGHGLKDLDLVLAVDALKAKEGGSMDKNMRRALQSDKYKTIRFSMKRYEVRGKEVTVEGDLSIHGTTKPVTLTGRMAPKGSAVSVTGAYPLLMSDYGVKPPVVMFMKVADKVTIDYSFLLQ